MRSSSWQPKSRNKSRTRARREFIRALRWLAHYSANDEVLAPPFAIRAYNAWAKFPTSADPDWARGAPRGGDL